MFGDVLVHSGCIRSRGPYCGMSYECVWVSSELILCQDPITVHRNDAMDIDEPVRAPHMPHYAPCGRQPRGQPPPTNPESS
jgi:hypothetical protein